MLNFNANGIAPVPESWEEMYDYVKEHQNEMFIVERSTINGVWHYNSDGKKRLLMQTWFPVFVAKSDRDTFIYLEGFMDMVRSFEQMTWGGKFFLDSDDLREMAKYLAESQIA